MADTFLDSVSVLSTSPLSILLVTFTSLLVFYFAYRWTLPKPIPGIPYNESARSILGDLPSILAHVRATDQMYSWFTEQITKHHSAIVQVFVFPLSKPWILVSDFRESQDILMRRTKEFDRSTLMGDIFAGMLPAFHNHMQSTNAQFKANRALLKDLMTPSFLLEVEAPQIYANTETLVQIWDLKRELAQGHPFAAAPDLYNEALDTVFAATFGLEPENSTTGTQLQFLRQKANEIHVPAAEDAPVEFPSRPRPVNFEAIITLTESFEHATKAPVPRLAHWFIRRLPYMRRATAIKEKLIYDRIEQAVQRLPTSSGQKNTLKRSALDEILQREAAQARKENRKPDFHARAIYDELFGFILAGHDSSSATLSWGLKHMAATPRVQAILRARLRSGFTAAAAERRNPTAEEIASAQIPYLDAFIEEMLRIACILPGVPRMATTDTTILGYPVAKGTNVWLLQTGPGYMEPPIPVPELRRARTSLESKLEIGAWNPDPVEMKQFLPERWLVQTDGGQETFNAQAGPSLHFGLGPRGCFGRRLAQLNLRIIVVMIVWNFDFLECPPELSSFRGYDKIIAQPVQSYVRLAKAKW